MATSLHSSKTPGIILSEIRMMGAAFHGVHFLLEGEDDCKFWRHHLNRANVSLVNCGGRPNLLAAARQIEASGIADAVGVAGVYDPDFDRLSSIPPHSPRLLVPTDANDLETTLLNSPALARLLSECADSTLLAAFENSHGVTVAEHIERTSREFGRLRYLNSIAGYCVDFNRLSPYRFVSQTNWSLDLAGLKTAFAQQAALGLDTLEAQLLAHCQDTAPWAYTQGHDATRILAQGLRGTIGQRQMDEKGITELLRLAYTDTMLKQTAMHAALCELEKNLPVPLFA